MLSLKIDYEVSATDHGKSSIVVSLNFFICFYDQTSRKRKGKRCFITRKSFLCPQFRHKQVAGGSGSGPNPDLLDPYLFGPNLFVEIRILPSTNKIMKKKP